MTAALPVVRLVVVGLVGALALVGAGCTDLPMPPELAAPQILGVRAANPAIPAGDRTALDLLLGGPEGIIEPDAVEWTVIGVDPSAPAVGSIEIVDEGDGDGEQVFYVAPDDVSAVELATIQVTVTSGDRTLEAVKGVAVGVPEATVNPAITELLVAGEPIGDGARVEMAVAEAAALDMGVSPAPGDDADYAWYSNVAEIDLFRRTPSELVASEEPGEGILIAVYRDGLGGIDWTSVELVVGP